MGEQIVPLADVMTDSKCAAILAEFRKLTLGPDLSAALDHAIAALRFPKPSHLQSLLDSTHLIGPKHQAPGIGWPVQCSATS